MAQPQTGAANPMAAMLAGLGGGGAGGAGAGGGGADMMAQLLPYIPKIMAVAKSAPGFIVGYLVTFLFFLVVYGPQKFKLEVAPVAGFHVVILVILAHVVPIALGVRQQVGAAKSKAKAVDSLSTDIKMRQQRLNQNDLD